MDHLTDPVELGAAIRRARQADRLTQRELAGVCGCSPRFIVELEQGKPTAQIGKVMHVLRMLGLRLAIASREGPHAS
ncbi:MAG: helix-turn-helix domain-containing protein [Planctomycetota bacterium]